MILDQWRWSATLAWQMRGRLGYRGHALMGDGVPIEVRLCDEIPLPPNGKYRPIVRRRSDGPT